MIYNDNDIIYGKFYVSLKEKRKIKKERQKTIFLPVVPTDH